MADRESAVLLAVMQYLSARGWQVYRRNVAGTLRMTNGGWAKFGAKGQADLYGWHRLSGRHIEVEVKAPGKRPTRDQELWLAQCAETGAVAFWCDSVQGCHDQLQEVTP